MKSAKTHIIIKHKNDAGVDQEDLYRANGMLVSCRQKDVVRYGSDISTARNHLFLNAQLASEFLRVMAEVDLAAQASGLPLHEVVDTYPAILEQGRHATFDEREMESLHSNLILPAAKRIV